MSWTLALEPPTGPHSASSASLRSSCYRLKTLISRFKARSTGKSYFRHPKSTNRNRFHRHPASQHRPRYAPDPSEPPSRFIHSKTKSRGCVPCNPSLSSPGTRAGAIGGFATLPRWNRLEKHPVEGLRTSDGLKCSFRDPFRAPFGRKSPYNRVATPRPFELREGDPRRSAAPGAALSEPNILKQTPHHTPRHSRTEDSGKF